MNKNFSATVMIIISSKLARLAGIEYANATCVIENMVIEATSLGIDNIVWAGAIATINQNNSLKLELGIPNEYKPLLCISLVTLKNR